MASLRILAGVALASIALAMAGCVATEPAEVLASVSSSTPTPSAAPTGGTDDFVSAPFDGDCESAASAASEEPTEVRPLDVLGFAIVAQHSLHCQVVGGAELIVVPTETAPAALRDEFSATGCDDSDYERRCWSSGEVGDWWVLVVENVAEEISTVPGSVATAFSGLSGALGAMSLASGILAPSEARTECTPMGETIGVAELLGSDDLYPGVYRDGRTALIERLALDLGALTECAWTNPETVEAVRVAVYTDTAAHWPAILADESDAETAVTADGGVILSEARAIGVSRDDVVSVTVMRAGPDAGEPEAIWRIVTTER